MKKYWILPLIILNVLIIASYFRGQNTTKTGDFQVFLARNYNVDLPPSEGTAIWIAAVCIFLFTTFVLWLAQSKKARRK